MSSSCKLFAFVPIDGYGHVNSLLGIADTLKSRGHKTVFICNDNDSTSQKHETIILRKGTLTQQQEQQHSDANNVVDDHDDVSQLDRKWMSAVEALDLESEPSKQLARNFAVLDYTIKMEILDMNERLAEVLGRLKPDVVVVDQLCTVPSIMAADSPYKWVRSQSCNPMGLYWEKFPDWFPAPLLGVASNSPKEALEKSWSDFRQAISCCGDTIGKLCQQAKLTEYKLINESPYLNLYMYPACIDYSDQLLRASGGTLNKMPNWHRCDSLIRAFDPWELPEELREKPGKLIYVSLGTTTSCMVPLMKRLISILAKTEHRVILSLGARHKQLHPLPKNMWGQKYVNQPAILPLIDLMITHGGNNTITEALYFGVPGMIVCPMFHDQLDNAARIEELGYGLRLDLFRCTEEQLLDSIHRLISDVECKRKNQQVSNEMRKNQRGAQWAAELLERVAEGEKFV